MYKDLVDFTIGAEALTAIDGGLTDVETNTDTFLVALPPEEIKRLAKIGLKTETFAYKALELGKLNIDLLPRNLDLDKLERDVAAREQLAIRFARIKRERHERPAPCCLKLPLQIGLPFPGEGGDTIVGAFIAQAHQLSMQLLQGSLLLARLLGFRLQPRRQAVCKRIKLARPLRHLELWLSAINPQIFADGVPGQASPATNLPDR